MAELSFDPEKFKASKELTFDPKRLSSSKKPVAVEEPQMQGFDIMGVSTGGTMPSAKRSEMPYGEQIEKSGQAAGEIYSAVGRGATKGLFGGPGAVEELFAYTVPEKLGFEKTPEKDRLTLFPTPRNIEGMMEYLNLGKTPEQYRPFETAAEVVGGLKTYGTPPAQAVGRGVKSTKETVEGLSPARAIEKGLGKPTTVSEIGKDIDKTIGGRLKSFIEARRPEAEKIFKNYFDKGSKVEGQILQDYKTALNEYWYKNAADMTGQERAFVKSAYDRLGEVPASLTGEVAKTGLETGTTKAGTVRPSIKQLEGERRFIGNIESGMIREGYEALPKARVSAVKQILENSIRKHVGDEFDVAKEIYTKLSEPINLYNTKLGKAVTKKVDEFLPEIAAADPAKLPAKFFESQRSAQELKALSGDAKVAEDYARRHLANELEGVKTAEQLKKYARDNRDWLQEFPALQTEVDRLASSVRSGEKVKNLGKILGGVGLGAVGLKSIQSLSPF